MSDYEQAEWTANRSYLCMGARRGCYREGVFRHPAGLVEVYEHTGSNPVLSLRFRCRGRDYIRRWATNWTDKTIARLAREMIEELSEIGLTG